MSAQLYIDINNMPVAPKTSYKQPRAGPSSHAGTSKRQHHPQPAKDPNAPMGVSKIKAAIRQTTRLLAKEKLDPALRISSERRLTSLKADLAAADKREVEKKNGQRYHMVKFFERQKLVRIIRRLQRTLAVDEEENEERKHAKRDLEDARIMLNYVLNYPNTQKYISLFPPAGDAKKVDAHEKRLTLPPLLPSPYRPQYPAPSKGNPLDTTATQRLEMLNNTRKLMKDGQLSETPDEGLGSGREKPQGVSIGNEKTETKEEGEVETKVDDDFFDVEDGEVSS